MPGGRGQVPWPDLERHRLIAGLPPRGMTLAQIGRRLGVSRQAVHCYLTRPLRSAQPGVACRGCGGVAVPAGARVRERGEGLCPACLRRRGAPFRRVFRACRRAAGINRAELARRTGISATSIGEYEAGRMHPTPATLARLAAVLGEGLLPPE